MTSNLTAASNYHSPLTTHLSRLAAIIITAFLLIPGTTQAADEALMARRIDELLAVRWEAEGVTPADLASDAEFLRRVYLDLTGTTPHVAEARAFLADGDPHKRQKLIDRLLGLEPDSAGVERPQYATHMAATWRAFLLPQSADLRRFGGGANFEFWLRNQFADNVPYDQTVRELLLAEGQALQAGPGLFYSVLQAKPEELATATSRSLLGVQIGCAQCHNHPFDHWTQRDFWSYAAFFARMQQPAQPQQFVTVVQELPEGEIKLPDSDEVVRPKYLSGSEIEAGADAGTSRRKLLADWMTSPENPYLARATVNRVWAHLFGRGLVEPVDDLGDHNPPSHPELLDELAEYFVGSGFDLRQLVRTLAMTRAYQLSSVSPSSEPPAAQLYARMAVKSLTAEQLYDCLLAATGKRHGAAAGQQFGGNRAFDPNRQAFLNRFAAPAGSVTEYHAGIPQALTLMNGALVRGGTDIAQSDILLALDAPFFSDGQRVETLFLATLSRLPSDAERSKFVEHVARRESQKEKHAALSDILWALLNTAEFTLNH